MANYILRSEKSYCAVKMAGNYEADKVLEIYQAKEPDSKWTECQLIPSGKHICKYCSQIAEGTDDELLCGECRETFGHALYTEL